MKYCIVENGIVTNIIICDDEESANKLGAVAYYDGAKIGSKYDNMTHIIIMLLRS